MRRYSEWVIFLFNNFIVLPFGWMCKYTHKNRNELETFNENKSKLYILYINTCIFIVVKRKSQIYRRQILYFKLLNWKRLWHMIFSWNILCQSIYDIKWEWQWIIIDVSTKSRLKKDSNCQTGEPKFSLSFIITPTKYVPIINWNCTQAYANTNFPQWNKKKDNNLTLLLDNSYSDDDGMLIYCKKQRNG